MLFGGNLTKQPAYIGEKFDIVGRLENSDIVMNNTFWIGVYPGITNEMLVYIVNCFEDFLGKY
jgi:CDP-6-deoxy-D-xylo-4-hexulose-3-dehydrase